MTFVPLSCPGPLRVFIVGDEVSVLGTLEAHLIELGHTLAGRAICGTDALEALAAARADLVISRIHLSGPWDGFETAAQVRVAHDLPVVMLAAPSEMIVPDRLPSPSSGVVGYLTPPFGDHDIRSAIQMATFSHAMERRLREANERLEAAVSERTAVLDRQVEARTAELAASDRFGRAILDSLASHVAVLDEHGTILTANAAWMRFAALQGASPEAVGVGANYFHVVQRAAASHCEEGAAFATGIRRVLEGVVERFEMEYPCDIPGAGRRWFLARITRFDADSGTRLVVSHEDMTAARVALAAIGEQERKFRAIFDYSPHPIAMYDRPGGRLIEINDAGLREFGFERDEVLQRTTSELRLWANDGDRDRYLGALAQHGKVEDMELRLATRQGRTCTALVSACKVQIGGHHRLLVFLRDITERKLRENALNILSAGVAHLGGQRFFDQVTVEITRLLEVEIGFIGRLMRPERARMALMSCCVDGTVQVPAGYDLAETPCEAVAGGEPLFIAEGVQRRFPRDIALADLGSESYAAVPLADSAGRVLGHIGVMGRHPLKDERVVLSILRLFAVRVAAEMERQISEQMFQDLVELSPDGILMVGQGGQVERANRQAAIIFGYGVDELNGLNVEALMPMAAGQRHIALREAFLQTTVPRPMGAGRRNLFGRKKDGTNFPVDISLNPIETEDGRKVIATVRDISAQVKLEQHISRTQRLEAIGTLAGGISHDLNNALFPILMSGEALRMRYRDDQETVNLILKSAERASAMVRQLVDFAKGAEGARATLNVLRLLDEIERIIRSTFPKNIEIAVNSAPSLPALRGDITQLHQVLLNLCVNARDAMPEGGALTLAATSELVDESAAAGIPYGKAGHFLVLSVSDTGTGIPTEIAGKIFDPFFSTKGPDMGSGLGLANVLSIARGHGGFVNVHSQPGNGSTFSLYLPAGGEALELEEAIVRDAVAKGGGARILYVDDEEPIRFVVQGVLRRRGFFVETAANGRDALDKFGNGPWDAIVTDLHMPRMDGLALVRALSERHCQTPIILASGRLEEEALCEARALGIAVCLEKPFSEDTLLAALNEAVQAANPIPISRP